MLGGSQLGPAPAVVCGAVLLVCSFLAAATPAQAFAPSVVFQSTGASRCASSCLQLRMAEGKGFGKPSEQPKKAPKEGSGEEVKSVEEQEEMLRKVMTSNNQKTGKMSPFAGGVEVEDGVSKQAARRGQRAEPVNLDAGAFFDAGWLKQSVDTVLSDDWVQGSAGAKESECSMCDGTGLKWWPIKAFRPCPECEKAGRAYNRRGQGLDEVLFGKDDMPLDYKKPTSGVACHPTT